MKKLILLPALAVAILFTSCGGEKKEEKKEESKPVTEETIQKFEDLKTEWFVVDGMIVELDGVMAAYDQTKNNNYVDSLRTLTEKLKGEIKDQAAVMLDSLSSINNQINEWVSVYQQEKETWGTITEDFKSVNTMIEKKEGTDDKIAPRAEGFTSQFNYKKETLGMLKAKVDAWKSFDDSVKALITPPAK